MFNLDSVVRLSILALIFFCGFESVAQQVERQTDAPPNIVLILADDLGYGDLACYGHPQNRTPHLDQMASEGMRFSDFHANGPMCSPTRAALLTGRYQNRFGRMFESALSAKRPEVGLPTGVPTIPALLKKSGYATALYGKWHLGYQHPHLPSDFGFDDFRGLLTGDGDHISHVSRSGTEDWYHNDVLEREEGYSSELITQHSVDFIRKNQDRPFFLYVSHLAIHFPWQAPGEKAHRELGTDYWNLQKLGPHQEGDVKHVVQAMVESVDNSVGAIMNALRQLDLDENTLVVFTSDNGGYLDYSGKFAGEISSNGVYRGQKTQVWEGGHRVPAIARWPGRIEAGSSTDEIVMTMDLLPTFARMAGAIPPDTCDGVSILNLLVNQNALEPRTLFWRADDEWAVRSGPWKLVGIGAKHQLFNLTTDPGETNDQATRFPEQVARLLTEYRSWEQDIGIP